MLSIICDSCLVPSVAITNAWVSPRVNKALPWVRGNTPVRMVMGRTVRVSRPSIRGKPLKMLPRTIFDSSSNMMLPTSTLAATVPAAASLALTSALMPLINWVRACLSVVLNAALSGSNAIASICACSASFLASAFQSHSGLPASRTRS